MGATVRDGSGKWPLSSMFFPGTSSAGGSVDHCIPIWYWMHWNKRLAEANMDASVGSVPPAEYEMMYYRQLEESAMVA